MLLQRMLKTIRSLLISKPIVRILCLARFCRACLILLRHIVYSASYPLCQFRPRGPIHSTPVHLSRHRHSHRGTRTRYPPEN
ncbi:hypothetical protein K443DRAFT_418856 [Laccaria amethystina LaAM-08-1]|uniref:Uncharacterized protein n=1 Tax=Laccaria amethystina LaAM-08-1 TaxID=1095629 RepID=A0A0C9WVV3_9AGAR|nr:hypothetical protein K443DRAFT_418856 [Laccaria amethystina LaAM-08-1]